MDEQTTDQVLRDHYQGHSLPDRRVRELEEMIRQGLDELKGRSPRQRSWGSSRITIAFASAAASLLLALTLLFLYEQPGRALFAGASPSPSIVEAATPRIVAVKFYAEWCKPSLVISPRVDALRQRYGEDGVLFVEVDLTNQETRNQANYLMSALGLEEIWRQQAGVTGELLLIDRREARVLSTLDQNHDLQQMVATLASLLNPA